MSRSQFAQSCFIALLIFIVYQVFRIFFPFAETIFGAAILVFAFYPVYEFLKGNLKFAPQLASLTTTGFIVLLVVLPLVYLIIQLASQGILLYQMVYDYVREGGVNDLIEQIRLNEYVQRFAQHFNFNGETWDLVKENATAWLLKISQSIGNFAAVQLGTITKNLFFISLNLFFLITLIFIFFQDGDKIYSFIYHAAPLEEKDKKPLFRQIDDTFAAVIRGQLLTAICQAIAAGMAFWFLGIPVPILFATLLFFVALIPFFGAAMVWVPWVLYFLIQRHYIKAVILLAFGTLVISLLDNLIKPLVIGEKTKLPYFLLFFGMLGGLTVYGFFGVFLAPVVLSLFFALIKIYQEKNW